jgi:hypothetical protein
MKKKIKATIQVFDFDKFISRPCIGGRDENGKLAEGIFGRKAKYVPASRKSRPFDILVDFHKAFEQVQIKVLELPLSSLEIAAFIRLCDMAKHYPKIRQGDGIEVDGDKFQIIDVQHHITGTQKVILHEQASHQNPSEE